MERSLRCQYSGKYSLDLKYKQEIQRTRDFCVKKTENTTTLYHPRQVEIEEELKIMKV